MINLKFTVIGLSKNYLIITILKWKVIDKKKFLNRFMDFDETLHKEST